MPSTAEVENEIRLATDPDAAPIPDELSQLILKKHHLLQARDVDLICSQEHRSGEGLVSGFIRRRSVSVLIGDSGLGKSPLAYQLGLCVAQGIPFLGLKTQSGRVIYADYENGLAESRDLREQLVRFLKIGKTPDNFLMWTPDFETQLDIDGMCRDSKPALFIIDSLRAHDPSFEKNENAGQGMSSLRSAAYKHGVGVLAVHHIRKPGPEGVPALDNDETVLMEWLNQASGHRSIINHSDTRIAAGIPKRVPDAAMVLRWHRRMKGEAGTLYVERVLDDEGGDLGYKVMVGAALLGNPDQREAFTKLPARFSFKEAKQIYGRTDDPTRKWLLKCQAAGLVAQVGRGDYHLVYRPIPYCKSAPNGPKTVEKVEDQAKVPVFA